MFVLRAVFVSLGFFGALYCILSVLAVGFWHVWNHVRPAPDPASPGLLLALRVFPLAASLLITLTLGLPAFLFLESDLIDEDFGTFAFTICFLLIFAAGLVRVLSARSRTSRVVAEWTEGANELETDSPIAALHTKSGAPPLVLVGVVEPKVLISETAVSLLSDDELRVAVQHEIGHMRSRDNLKKLVFHGSPFPGMASLEDAWQQAAELAADAAAVSNQRKAVDLAAALVKLSKVAPVYDPSTLTTAFVSLPTSIKLRVQRLLNWNEASIRKARNSAYFAAPVTLALVAYVAANYGRALLFTHRTTEWFVH